MSDEPIRVEIHDEGDIAGIPSGEDVRGGETGRLLARYGGDEVLVVVLEHGHHPRLQGVPDVLCLHDGLRLGVEDLLDVVEHRAGSAAAPCCVLAQGMQLLRGIAQPTTRVRDLRIGRHRDPVGALDREYDCHSTIVSPTTRGTATYVHYCEGANFLSACSAP